MGYTGTYKTVIDNWGTGYRFMEANLKIEKYDYIENGLLFILISDFFQPFIFRFVG